MKKFSWKTTLFGLLAGLGAIIAGVENAPVWFHYIGVILSGAGTYFLGQSARDNKVTSEEAGAKP